MLDINNFSNILKKEKLNYYWSNKGNGFFVCKFYLIKNFNSLTITIKNNNWFVSSKNKF